MIQETRNTVILTPTEAQQLAIDIMMHKNNEAGVVLEFTHRGDYTLNYLKVRGM